ncbi:fatty acyl-AMP ligase [Streptomyces sp. IB201691-2A2]|uniref:fatty acyl-AMP ligase n=1 Tax=Streptomyces sp. IB201691-2A2 TaxID=2561920 RepID=UPI00117C99A6|nr:fatty acyl-AMP ligase [Streptomyces sp. IB201691-2A2]TRO67956.1 fatty acyl-AMP ligase [Streptomyces sp. IB201691-2A2]
MTSLRPAAESASLTDHLRHWARHRPQQRAFSHVDFPDSAPTGVHRALGWRALDARARAVADRLVQIASPGERAALVMPQGLDYAAGFLGCLYARVIAVPLFGPQVPGHEGRLAAVLADCEPACLLSDSSMARAMGEFIRERGLPEVPVVPVDQLPVQRGGFIDSGEPSGASEPDDIAYLQYTSGSTRSPAGVMISHANVVANARQAIDAFIADPDAATTVGWLPLFHDMGLVLSIAAPVVGGFPSVLMDPSAFLQDPARWLRLLGSYEGTVSAAPNFAYDYCVARTDPALVDELRLDRVRVLINGSEPVRAGTVDRFHATFAPAGLDPAAHCPAYGLAEATVFVTASSRDEPSSAVACDADALTEGRIEETSDEAADEATAVLVPCGVPVGQELRIVGRNGAVLPQGRVGEIQLRGPNIGLGYWKRAGLTAETFGFGAAGDWLRTGDLGALHEGRLLVTGRLKDVLIVDGRNHYPQDIEETVQTAVPLIRRDHLAAFGVTRADDAGEDLIVVAEHRRDTRPMPEDTQNAERVVRAAISARHGLRLGSLLLVPPGSVPRTSSGKVSRAAARACFLDGGFGTR